MAIVLDTDQFDPHDRADVVASALQDVSAPAYIVHSPWHGSVYARYDSWQFGQLRLHRAVMSGLAVARTPKQIRNSPSSLLAIQLQQHGSVRLTYAGTQHEIAPGQLLISDLDMPHEIDWRGGQGLSMFVSREQLGLSVETIRTALIQPQRSPLYHFLAKQMALTSDVGDEMESDAGASAVGDACVELVRAFLMSAATHGKEDGNAVPQDILVTQIRAYVRSRLSDPDLNAASIARAHNISVRYLYKVCADAGLGLENSIIAQRLERVRNDLARPDIRHRTIAAIADSHGFRGPAHFSRRFRAVYGRTPSDWRREALERSSATEQSNVKLA
ncbi:helix-turn-helix domain-containing protein [Nocardia sp. CA-128927]|uniref:helix-turn-helix domain-containing protein n=1 Tax=Nocardia sp. CA-128927 TaxID=3239975 RepID=UPI003D9741D1